MEHSKTNLVVPAYISREERHILERSGNFKQIFYMPKTGKISRHDLTEGAGSSLLLDFSRIEANQVREISKQIGKNRINIWYHPNEESSVIFQGIFNQGLGGYRINKEFSPRNLSNPYEEGTLSYQLIQQTRLNNRVSRDLQEALSLPRYIPIYLDMIQALHLIEKGANVPIDTGECWVMYALAERGFDPFGSLNLLLKLYSHGLIDHPGNKDWRFSDTESIIRSTPIKPMAHNLDINYLLNWVEKHGYRMPVKMHSLYYWPLQIMNKLLTYNPPGHLITAERARRLLVFNRMITGSNENSAFGNLILGIINNYCPSLLDKCITIDEKITNWLVARKKLVKDIKDFNNYTPTTDKCKRCSRNYKVWASEFGPYLRCVCGSTKVYEKARLQGGCPQCGADLIQQEGAESVVSYIRCERWPTCSYVGV